MTTDPLDVADLAIQRTEVDGVPTRWLAETNAPFTGALMFRVGRADEHVSAGGLTHLVEHLALFALGGRQAYEFNGFVEGSRTAFVATGSPENVRDFLMTVCTALQNLPISRLEQEAKILRLEARGRSIGALEAHLWHRYGPVGPGSIAVREYGLEEPAEDSVLRWASERFTTANAAAWFSGPIPSGLRFDLPGGRRFPVVQPEPLKGLTTPAYLQGRSGGIGTSFVTSRSDWFAIVLEIVQARLQQQLRYEKGLIYSVQTGGQWLDAEKSHAVLTTECTDSTAQTVLEDNLMAFWRMSTEGASVAELRSSAEEFARHQAHPSAMFAYLDRSATDELVGHEFKPPRELLAELLSMTPETSAGVMERALATAILMEPTGRQINVPGFTPYPMWSANAVSGKRLKQTSAGWFAPKLLELILGKEGITLVQPDQRMVTVHWDNCEMVSVWPDGALVAHGSDGFEIRVVPAAWLGGVELMHTMRAAVPPERLITVADDDRVAPPQASGWT